MTGMFLIWSIEHEAWWASHEIGYTRAIDEAGVYSDQRSREIVERANRVSFNECRIPVACVRIEHQT